MADITSFQGGMMGDKHGKVNWRGDQVTVPQGGQSIYESSSVPLADLGSRLVVGDRVFRYAQIGGVAAVPGDLMQMIGTGLAAAEFVNTAGASDALGGKTFTFFSSTVRAQDFFAEGYIWAQSGTAANLGRMYRVKSHAALGSASNGTLFLYDALQSIPNTADKWSIVANPYKLVTQNTAATVPIAGVLISPATTNDYVWLQTWGPCPVKMSTNAVASGPIYAAATGAAKGFIATGTGGDVFTQIGSSLRVPVASQTELCFLTIAP